MAEADNNKNPRANYCEPAKLLPVVFIVSNIVILWGIYMGMHAIPLAQNPQTSAKGWAQIVVFNILSVLLWLCYVRAVLVHPGKVPRNGKECEACGTSGLVGRFFCNTCEKCNGTGRIQDGRWDYNGQPPDELMVQERKEKSGQRRHCKWCQQYKPDRCHHCRVCRTCILKMDHHCPWIYNCVGFGNHKYFFLLLFYSTAACHMASFTMLETVKDSLDADTPFAYMFILLFGETLAAFLGFLVTVFFIFHIWLMFKSMTTIEFCEKQMKGAYDSAGPTPYDRGFWGNIFAVLGDQPLLWFLPVNPPSGDGLYYEDDSRPLRELETGRGLRYGTDKPVRSTGDRRGRKHKSRHAGTGSAPTSNYEDSSVDLNAKPLPHHWPQDGSGRYLQPAY